VEEQFIQKTTHMLFRARYATMFALVLLCSYIPPSIHAQAWKSPSHVIATSIYFMLICITASVVVYITWVSRLPSQRLKGFERRVTKIIAAGFFLYPLTDNWRLPRIFKEDPYKINNIDFIDETLLIFGMVAVVIGSASYPLRASHSWLIPLSGSVSYSVLTLIYGAPERHPFKRTRLFRDVFKVVMLNFIFFMIWFGSSEKERYIRRQFQLVRETEQRLAVTESSLKGYVDCWAILHGKHIVESSDIIDQELGFDAESKLVGDLLVEDGTARFEAFLTDI